VSRVDSADGLSDAVAEALRWCDTVIAEQAVIGREVECGVLGGTKPRASVVGEVTVTGGAFDYQQKYQSDADPMVVPAPLDPAVAERVRDLSVRAFRAVGGWGLVRADFLIEATTGDVFVNELNTMPGFTAHSMYPKVWAATGISYPDLVARLIDLAFTRHSRSRQQRVSQTAPDSC
jgi:D-alanine-D-alanine ligase